MSDKAADTDNPTPVVFDFVHPQHQLGESFVGLSLLQDRMRSRCAASIGKLLRTKVDVVTCAAEYLKTSEFQAHLDQPSICYRFELKPLPGSGLLRLDLSLVDSAVQQFFGGSAAAGVENQDDTDEDDSEDTDNESEEEDTESEGEEGEDADSTEEEVVPQRAMSPTEKRIATRLKDILLDDLTAIVSELETVVLGELGEVSGHEITEGLIGTGVTVVMGFDLTTKCGSASFSVGLPHALLAPMRDRMANRSHGRHGDDISWRKALNQQVSECEIPLQGILAETELTVRQMLRLQTGDFIPLGGDQTATFLSDGYPLFEAVIGMSNGKISANLSRWYTRNNAAFGAAVEDSR